MGVNRDPATGAFPFSAGGRLWTQTWITGPLTGHMTSVRLLSTSKPQFPHL